MPFKYLVVLDFEATCDSNRDTFSPIEIIEWPAIIIDILQKKIYKLPNEYFHYYIKPKVNKELTSFCTELTGITQTMVNNGIYIENALSLWNKWCYNNNLLPNNNNNNNEANACIVTCGDWDLRTMWTKQSQLSAFSFNQNACLFHSWINIKIIFQKLMNVKPFGMMNMLNILNIKHIGKHHSGIDDVKNISNIIIKLLNINQNAFNNYTTYNKNKKSNFNRYNDRSIWDDIIFKHKMDKITQIIANPRIEQTVDTYLIKKGLKCIEYVYSFGIIGYKCVNNNLFYLLIQHKRNKEWGFPKGHFEIGIESKYGYDTAKREFTEETGIEFKLNDTIICIDWNNPFNIKYEYKRKNKLIKKATVLFVAQLSNKVKPKIIRPNEIRDVKFVSFKEFNQKNKHIEYKNVITKLHKKLIKKYNLNLSDDGDDEKKEKEKRTTKISIVPILSNLAIKKCKLPWINNQNGINMNIVQFFHANPSYFGAQFAVPFKCDINIDTSTKIYTLNNNTTTLLYNVDQNNKFVKFKSVEHIYQCAKAVNVFDDLFMRTLSSYDAARCGRGKLEIKKNKSKKLYESLGGKCIEKGKGKKKRYIIDGFKLRNNWDDIKIQIMFHGLKQKFIQNKYLIDEYINNNLPIYFIEHTQDPNDNLWGDGGILGNGKNYLGKLMTIILWMMKYKLNQFKNDKNNKNCVVDLLGDTFLKWMELPNNEICT